MSNLVFRKESDMEDSDGGGGGVEWAGSPPRPSSVFLDDRTNSGGCLGGVMDPTELTHLGGKLAIPGRMGDGPLCGLCEGAVRALCGLCEGAVRRCEGM